MNIARLPLAVLGPVRLRPVPVELDAVLIGIAQVERLADPVVARAVELDAGRDQPPQRVRQGGPGRVEDRGVEQPRGAGRGRLAAEALPGVEADMVVVAAGRDEGGLGAVFLHQREAEHPAVEGERAIEVGHLQMDMADLRARVDGAEGPAFGLWLAHAVWSSWRESSGAFRLRRTHASTLHGFRVLLTARSVSDCRNFDPA